MFEGFAHQTVSANGIRINVRCLPLDEQLAKPGICICCGRSAGIAAVWAQG